MPKIENFKEEKVSFCSVWEISALDHFALFLSVHRDTALMVDARGGRGHLMLAYKQRGQEEEGLGSQYPCKSTPPMI